jgi:hypothetical protein
MKVNFWIMEVVCQTVSNRILIKNIKLAPVSLAINRVRPVQMGLVVKLVRSELCSCLIIYALAIQTANHVMESQIKTVFPAKIQIKYSSMDSV